MVSVALGLSATRGASADAGPGERDAATWHLAVQTYSWHEGGAQGVHDWTPGIGLMRRQGPWLAGAGLFRNSLGREAGFAYVGWQKPFRRVRLGGILGATHRYYWNDGGIVPLLAAVVTVPLSSRWSTEFIAVPPVKDVSYATVNVTLSWRFR